MTEIPLGDGDGTFILLAPHSTWLQVLALCTLVGVGVVLYQLVRAAVIVVTAVYVVIRELRAAHRRGMARVRAYDATLKAEP